LIVSHRHKFIFLKTRKTAGTSIELALSEICGPDDILTDVGRDEALRKGLRPQNLKVDRRRLPLATRVKLALGAPADKIGAAYASHAPASVVKRLVGETVWDDYLKISIERNPWDRQVSFYFFLHREPDQRPDFETYLSDPKYKARMNNFGIYAINGRIAVDRVLRYEQLQDDYAVLMRDLGIAEPPALMHAKGGSRPKDSDYRAMYTDKTRDIVARWYADEIREFGYRFDDPA